MTNADFDGSAGETFDECIEMHWGLVCKVMQIAEEKYPDIAGYRDEYEQEMRIKLWDAWRGFDPSMGWRFSTYAYKALTREMWRAKARLTDSRIDLRTKTPNKVKMADCMSLDTPVGEGGNTARDFIADERDQDREARVAEARRVMAVAVDSAEGEDAEWGAKLTRFWLSYKHKQMSWRIYKNHYSHVRQFQVEDAARELVESATRAGLLSDAEFLEIE